MPPAAEPVQQRIIDDMLTALGLIQGGSDYFTTVTVLEAGKDPLSAGIHPSVSLNVGGFGRIQETDPSNRVLWSHSQFWQVVVVATIEGFDDVRRRLIEICADVVHALMINPRRGGIAINTTFTGVDFFPPPDDGTGIAWCEVGFQVQYRTQEGDLTVAV